MKILFSILFILTIYSQSYSVTRFVRLGGSNATNCTGLSDVDYDGSGTGEACALNSLTLAISAAVCGDVIKAAAGQIFGPQSYVLPNKSCTGIAGSKITITSNQTQPNRRIGRNVIEDNVPDEAIQPAFVTNGATSPSTYGAVFVFGINSGWWIIDGLTFRDSGTPNATIINMLIDIGLEFTGVHDIEVTRCIFEQKETGANYHRSVMRAVWFEGTNLTFTRNYVHLIGWYYDETGNTNFYPMDTEALLSVGGPGPILFHDNFISVWYNGIFLGGADTGPQNTSTITGGTTTGGTFSNTTGLTTGLIIRLEMQGVGTFAGTTFTCAAPNPNGYPCGTYTRTSGVTLNSTDEHANSLSGSPIVFEQGGIFRRGLVWRDLGGGVAEITQNGVNPAGTHNATLMQTAKIVSVIGSAVTYAAFGIDGITAGKVPTSASWNFGDQGLISDVTVTKNTWNVDPLFAAENFSHRGSNPKGMFEIKNCNRFEFAGNHIVGWPTVMGFTSANQSGTSPWMTTTKIKIHDNYYHPTEGTSLTGGLGYDGRGIIISNDGYIQTDTDGQDVEIYNNLLINTAALGSFKAMTNWDIYNNTIINNQGTFTGYNSFAQVQAEPMIGLDFRNNIINYKANGGFQIFVGGGTYAEGMPSAVFTNNVLIDTQAQGFSVGHLGALGPIPTTIAGVGFVNTMTNNYRLAPSSSYKNDGSDGEDPGVKWNQLVTALGFDPSGVAIICNWNTNPACQ